ncbi:MAG: tetratricopeptide repeat protein, partial [Steroidobacteraceae bacterium]
ARSLNDIIRAADLGDYQASAVLIMAYGSKPEAPVPSMLAYMQRHVERGHAYAQVALAFAYDYGRHGLLPNPEKAFELYSLAAGQGDAHAQCCVGICYAYGRGAQLDEEQAVHCYPFYSTQLSEA